MSDSPTTGSPVQGRAPSDTLAEQWFSELQNTAAQIKMAGIPIDLQRPWTMRQLHDIARKNGYRLKIRVERNEQSPK